MHLISMYWQESYQVDQREVYDHGQTSRDLQEYSNSPAPRSKSAISNIRLVNFC